MNIQGKAEILEFLNQQEQQAAAMQQEQQQVAHAFQHAELQELMSKAAANIARAREDHSRSESNLGLYEERLSMIERNRALTLKEKQAALRELLESMQLFGKIETEYAENKLNIDAFEVRSKEEQEKQDVQRKTESNKFMMEILKGIPMMDENQGNMLQQNQQQAPEMAMR
jgi:hypothetical protein